MPLPQLRTVTDDERKVFQDLADKSWRNVQTRDAKGFPASGVEILQVSELINPALTKQYEERKMQIRNDIGKHQKVRDYWRGKRETLFASGEHVSKPYKAQTNNILDLDNEYPQNIRTLLDQSQLKLNIDSTVNEEFLFHGTTVNAVFGTSASGGVEKENQGILEGGFRAPKDRGDVRTSALYGEGGIYFAESFTKADEYTVGEKKFKLPEAEHHDMEDDSLRHVLLCRVAMGNTLYIEKDDDEHKHKLVDKIKQCNLAGADQKTKDWCVTKMGIRSIWHSLIGDREAFRGTYKEFIVYNETNILPAFVIKYRRKYDKINPNGDNFSYYRRNKTARKKAWDQATSRERDQLLAMCAMREAVELSGEKMIKDGSFLQDMQGYVQQHLTEFVQEYLVVSEVNGGDVHADKQQRLWFLLTQPGFTALHAALFLRDTSLVRNYLDAASTGTELRAAALKSPTGFSREDTKKLLYRNESPLHIALRLSKHMMHSTSQAEHPVAKILLKEFSINKMPPETAKEIIMELERDSAGMLPIHIAVERSHTWSIEQMCRAAGGTHGACRAMLGQEFKETKFQPIHFAAKHNHCDVVTTLFEVGGLPILRAKTSTTRETPLHVAVRGGHLNIVEYLLLKDAVQPWVQNIHKYPLSFPPECTLVACDVDGNAPIHVAVQKRDFRIVQRLKELGGTKTLLVQNARTGRTTLHEAVSNYSEDDEDATRIVNYLCDSMENHRSRRQYMMMQDSNGNTVFDYPTSWYLWALLNKKLMFGSWC